MCDIDMKEIPKYIKEFGVPWLEKFIKQNLEIWKDIEINIGVTGDSGVGKSSFINAVRG